jgi:hypothetical protein
MGLMAAMSGKSQLKPLVVRDVRQLRWTKLLYQGNTSLLLSETGNKRFVSSDPCLQSGPSVCLGDLMSESHVYVQQVKPKKHVSRSCVPGHGQPHENTGSEGCKQK